jgi:hypothetical protein
MNSLSQRDLPFLVAASPSAVPPPLDLVAGSDGAYSTARLLRTAYGGSAIRVRRASDNAEQDIGFTVDNILDEASLSTFCSGTTGHVTTVYDQSGSAKDMIQATAGDQPLIYTGGAIIKVTEGFPALEADGAATHIVRVSAGELNPNTVLLVANPQTSVNNDIVMDGGSIWRMLLWQDGPANHYYWMETSTGKNDINTVGAPPLTTYLFSMVFNAASSKLQIDNNANETLDLFHNVGTVGITWGADANGNFGSNTQFCEALKYNSVISDANRNILRDNINSFYGLY